MNAIELGSRWRHKTRKAVVEVTAVDDTHVAFKVIELKSGQRVNATSRALRAVWTSYYEPMSC